MSNKPRVIIVLLNYKGSGNTIACLQSLRDISYPNYNIIIVDNDSPDGSMEVIGRYLSSEGMDHAIYNRPYKALEYAGKLPFVTFIQSGRNGGYGHGNNIGIKYALANSADYVLALNNDTVVDPGFLEPLVEMCEADANIGIASAKIYFHDRPDIIWFNGGKFHPYTTKVEHVNFNDIDIGQKPPAENTFISGCLWLIPKKVFEAVGFINEDYFMYVEDLEYCQRVLNQGYTLKVCEMSHIFHKVGSSSGHWSPFFAYWMARNRMKFISEFSTGICKLSAVFYHVFYFSLWWLFHQRFDLFRAHLKGIFANKNRDVSCGIR